MSDWTDQDDAMYKQMELEGKIKELEEQDNLRKIIAQRKVLNAAHVAGRMTAVKILTDAGHTEAEAFSLLSKDPEFVRDTIIQGYVHQAQQAVQRFRDKSGRFISNAEAQRRGLTQAPAQGELPYDNVKSRAQAT